MSMGGGLDVDRALPEVDDRKCPSPGCCGRIRKRTMMTRPTDSSSLLLKTKEIVSGPANKIEKRETTKTTQASRNKQDEARAWGFIVSFVGRACLPGLG